MGEQVVVQFQDEDLADGDVERLTLSLREELLHVLEVDRVDPVHAGSAPGDARAIGVVELGGLLVSMKPTADGLVKVVGVLRGWLANLANVAGSRKSVLRITVNGQSLELTPTKEQQQKLLDEFIKAAATNAG